MCLYMIVMFGFTCIFSTNQRTQCRFGSQDAGPLPSHSLEHLLNEDPAKVAIVVYRLYINHHLDTYVHKYELTFKICW